MKNKHSKIIALLLLISFLCVAILFVKGCFSKPPVPDHGNWYCEELQLQIGIGVDGASFIISENGEKTICSTSNLPGTSQIVVHCQDNDCEEWDLGDVVFSGDCIKYDDTTLQIQERYTNTVYTFELWMSTGDVSGPDSE